MPGPGTNKNGFTNMKLNWFFVIKLKQPIRFMTWGDKTILFIPMP